MNQIQVELQSFMGNDRSIADSAWTSSLDYQKKQARTDNDVKKIINMLADAKHSVPFESVIFRFWMRIPVATDRQIMTHRIQSASGMSGRYRTMPNEWLSPPDDVIQILKDIGADNHLENEYELFCKRANDWYQNAIANLKTLRDLGSPLTNDGYKRLREFFRGVLPQHNMTERVSIMNLRAWCNFYKLRSKPDAQPEIRLVAQKMLEEIKTKSAIPIALECLERNNWII